MLRMNAVWPWCCLEFDIFGIDWFSINIKLIALCAVFIRARGLFRLKNRFFHVSVKIDRSNPAHGVGV
jgi:hypothetical protein